MVHEQKLSAVLSEFAHTLSTDFPVQAILEHLVDRIVEILPITAAGVTLISDGVAPRYIAASDTAALRYEELQTELGEGPCLAAYRSGEAVAVADLAADDRFPRFAPAAVAAGLGAVFTFPLRHGQGRLGALDLYRQTPGGLNAHDMAAAQTLADVAAAYLLNAQARQHASDVSERFRDIALHDVLTGLPNRLLLQQRIEHAALRAQRSHSYAAVLFADLDRFKQVNDTHGHHVGDELLRSVAERLSNLVRPGDTLARISGDEFVILCEDLRSPEDAEILARRFDECFAEPFVVGGVSLTVTASVGMAFAGPGETITTGLIDMADKAMYQAKRNGGGRHQIIDIRAAHATTQQNRLEQDLHTAFVHGQLDVAYQPIVRTTDGLVVGVEALLRWTDHDRGPVSAASMVEVAERSGLIVKIGAWVLETACTARSRWLTHCPWAPLELAVNVSAHQLASKGFVDTVARVLDTTGMDPRALVLEVTENVFILDTERAISVLAQLKRLDIRIALDDFGTGYSSLSYLARLPIDILKVDRGFVAGLRRHASAATIVTAVTDLAHGLGLAVIAEGVETSQERDAIRAIGCDFCQGYFYGKPMPANAIASTLLRGPRDRTITLPDPEAFGIDLATAKVVGG
jgi:diguanylate cyclase (GGDEF)-like protein